MKNYEITKLQALKEGIFGSPEFADNDYFRGCTRASVMTSDNVYFKVKIDASVYHDKTKIAKAIYNYSCDADRLVLVNALADVKVTVDIADFTFPYTISQGLLEGQDPQVEQTLTLRALTDEHHDDDDMPQQLHQWSVLLNNMDETNPFFKIPKFEIIEIRFWR